MDNKKSTNKILNIGSNVDKLDRSTIGAFNIDSLEQLVSLIEDEFIEINYENLENDEAIPYLYTKANYLHILNRLIKTDFEKALSITKFLTSESYDKVLQDSFIERIKLYRLALDKYDEKSKIPAAYMVQVSTNLANLYYEMGRIVESIETLQNARQILKDFPMSAGNYAIKHHTLAECCIEDDKSKFLLEKALTELDPILKGEYDLRYIEADQLELFFNWNDYIEDIIMNFYSEVDAWTEEKDVDDSYKDWSSRKHLSLNYINVVYPFGNIDDLHLPNMGIGYFRENPYLTYYSWFNTIKQEYNMARYWLYETENLEEMDAPHESQRNNFIVNTLDYPAIGYRTELLKTSLRTSYSILDKIGLFCSDFFKLDNKAKAVSFEKWYREIESDIALESVFMPLYWLSKDLDFKDGYLKDIRRLRNYLEHRYVRVLDHYDVSVSEEFADDNKFEYTISYSELEKIAYETLKLVRAAIFYLINGFNKLYLRLKNQGEGIFIPLLLDIYEDEWKN